MIKNLGIEILGPDTEEGKNILFGTDIPAESTPEDSDEASKGVVKEQTTTEEDEDALVILPPGDATEEIPEEEAPVNMRSSQSDILAFAQDLFEEGLIDLDKEEALEDFTKRDLMERINDAIEQKNKSYKEEYSKKFSGAKKKFLEIEDSFDNEQQAMVIAQDMNILENVKDSDIEGNAQLAEWIIGRTLAYRGADNKEIQERIEELKDLDKVESYAKDYAPKLKSRLENEVESNRAAKDKAAKEALEEQKSYYEDLIDTVDSSDEIIPGLELTKRMKDTMKKKMTEVVHKDENGREYNELGYKQLKHSKEFNIAIEHLNAIGLMNFDKKGRYKPDLKVLSKIMGKEMRKGVDRLISEEQKIGRPGNISEGTIDQQERLKFFEEATKAWGS